MPRVKDIAWKFVIKLEGEKWRCRYCENECNGNFTRVKSHLLAISGKGITLCTKVPEYIKELMRWLTNQVRSKDDIAWKFVDKLEDNKWCCYHCSEVFCGDLTGVKGHLLGVPNEGISICLGVPDHVKTLMKSLLDEATEEESRGAAEGKSREAHHQSSVAPLSHDMPTEAEVAEEESGDYVMDYVAETGSWNMSPPTMVLAPEFETNMENFLSDEDHSLKDVFAELSMVQIGDGEAEVEADLQDLPDQPQRSIPSQMQMPMDIGDSNCHQHSQSQIPMDIDPSIASHISEAPNLEIQVPVATTNAIGPSSSQASVNPQRQSVPQPSINHETRDALQNPTVPSSSCNIHSGTSLPAALMELDPHILQSSQAPHNAPPLPQIPTYGTALMFPYPSSDMTTGAPVTSLQETAKNSGKIGVLKRKLKRLCSVQAGIKDELDYAAGSLSLKKPRKEVANWLTDVDKLINDFPWTESVSEDHLPSDKEVDVVMQEAEELITRESNFLRGLLEVRVTQFTKFLEEKMVGEAFQRNTTKILEYLVGDQVSRLGIYGMGGVGKTTIMRYVHNRLCEKENYGNVFWVTVSQDFNPQKLQDDIWKALGLGTLEEKDLGKRAAMLSSCLMERGKSTIILDDVWKDFDLEMVGIPIRADRFKLVLTTRSFDVCCKMQCQEKIKIEPLSQEEAESLFFEELGSEAALNSEIEVVAKSIIRECAGLPLGVITMARSMRGVIDMFEWKDSLEKLKKSDMGQTEMESKVLMKLKVSYDRLDNHDVQQCFLSCALYPEDYRIEYDELIEFFIDQGFFDKLDTRKKQYYRGFTILNKLKNACLLEDDEECIVMHDLIRDMALHIMSTTSIVKGGQELIRIPSEEYWTDALEKVSLMGECTIQFSSDVPPNCPKLSIIILQENFFHDVVVPDSFFKHLRQLKVLNFSGFGQLRELPSSISVLVNLRALLLTQCLELRHIPHLGELRSLRKLDVTNCRNLEALNGLGMLVNLRYLNLLGTKIEILPKGTLGGLKNLQWLLVNSVHVEDFANVWPLERFQCEFKGANDFNEFVRVIWEKSNPQYYRLLVSRDVFRVSIGDEPDVARKLWTRMVEIEKMRDAIVIERGESTDDCILIPHDVQELICRKDDCITDLSGMCPLENLEHLCIEEWKKLRVLCGGPDKDVTGGHDSRAPTTAPLLFPSFPSLVKLRIHGCGNLKYLFGHGSKFDLPHLQSIDIMSCKKMIGITVEVAPPPPHPSSAFPSLTLITVTWCGKMKRVVEPEWLPHFPKLSKITVVYCDEMEEIIGVPPLYTPVEETSFECLTEQDVLGIRKSYIPDSKYFRVQVEQGQERSTHNAPSSSQSSISLPKLTYLKLSGMARLKSIGAPIFYDPMNVLEVRQCPGLSFANCS